MAHHQIEQLHFDVPLISTRRSTSTKANFLLYQDDDYIDTSRSIPFSWEAAPGVPKRIISNPRNDDDILTPKPPPCRYQNRSITRAPSFIMNRFLPAANAIAAASVRSNARPRNAGCGIFDLFSLRLCRLKNPGACQVPRLAGTGTELSSDDGLSSKACKSPGWGLPFLDTSRVCVDLEKGRRLVDGRRIGRTVPGKSLPLMKAPKDPWLAHALRSGNSRY